MHTPVIGIWHDIVGAQRIFSLAHPPSSIVPKAWMLSSCTKLPIAVMSFYVKMWEFYYGFENKIQLLSFYSDSTDMDVLYVWCSFYLNWWQVLLGAEFSAVCVFAHALNSILVVIVIEVCLDLDCWWRSQDNRSTKSLRALLHFSLSWTWSIGFVFLFYFILFLMKTNSFSGTYLETQSEFLGASIDVKIGNFDLMLKYPRIINLLVCHVSEIPAI